MGLRTVDDYLLGLRDGRAVYVRRERVADVTLHSELATAVRHATLDFELGQQPAFQDLFVCRMKRGEPYSRFFQLPRSGADLLRRWELMVECTRQGKGLRAGNLGTDALLALMFILPRLQSLAPARAEYLQHFYDYCRCSHLVLAGAALDVNADDALRVVAEWPDGIVVRGAKMLVAAAGLADELVVLPGAVQAARSPESALAFAVTPATPGVKIVSQPQADPGFELPIRHHHDLPTATVIFENVFVTHERVFLRGETELVESLVTALHRWSGFSDLACTIPLADLVLGTAQLLAECQGLMTAPEVQDKLTELHTYAETLRACGGAAALNCEVNAAGMAIPAPGGQRRSSAHSRLWFSSLCDLTGDLLVAGLTEADLRSPELGPALHRYLGQNPEMPAAVRLRVINLARDVLALGCRQVAQMPPAELASVHWDPVARRQHLERTRQWALQVAGIDEEAMV